MDSILLLLVKFIITIGVVVLAMVPYSVIMDDRGFNDKEKYIHKYDRIYATIFKYLICYILVNIVIGVVVAILSALILLWTR